MESLFMQEHERWLKIVEVDLRSAKVLLKAEVFSSATYHCQQAAEKALKAYLAFKNQKIIKIHDLVMLVELCSKFDKDFEKLYDNAEYLNPFVTKFRYPTEFDIPDCADTKHAIEQAGKIVKFVLKKIAEPNAGQQTLF
jgi:HEPN domain-containing protein